MTACSNLSPPWGCSYWLPNCPLDKEKWHTLKQAWQRLSGLKPINGECCSLGKTSSALLTNVQVLLLFYTSFFQLRSTRSVQKQIWRILFDLVAFKSRIYCPFLKLQIDRLYFLPRRFHMKKHEKMILIGHISFGFKKLKLGHRLMNIDMDVQLS